MKDCFAQLGCRGGGTQPLAIAQLTETGLERHLQGMTEKLQSGVNGKVRKAIQHSVARVLVSVNGSLTIHAWTDGLLGVNEDLGQLVNGEQYSAEVSVGQRLWMATSSAVSKIPRDKIEWVET